MEVQLADLLLQCHAGHQVVDLAVHGGLGSAGREGEQQDQEGKGVREVFHGLNIRKKTIEDFLLTLQKTTISDLPTCVVFSYLLCFYSTHW